MVAHHGVLGGNEDHIASPIQQGILRHLLGQEEAALQVQVHQVVPNLLLYVYRLFQKIHSGDVHQHIHPKAVLADGFRRRLDLRCLHQVGTVDVDGAGGIAPLQLLCLGFQGGTLLRLVQQEQALRPGGAVALRHGVA